MTPSRPASRRTSSSRSASSPHANGSGRSKGMRTEVKSTSMSAQEQAGGQQDAEEELQEPRAGQRLVQRGAVGVLTHEAYDRRGQRQREPRQQQPRRQRPGDPRQRRRQEGEVDHRGVEASG